MNVPILDSSPSSQGCLECFCAYVTLILHQANIPLVAYDGAIAMEPILSYFEIGTSWKGDLWACPLCFVSHPYLARCYLNVDTLCHLHSATRDCIIIGVRQTRSWSAREMPHGHRFLFLIFPRFPCHRWATPILGKGCGLRRVVK